MKHYLKKIFYLFLILIYLGCTTRKDNVDITLDDKVYVMSWEKYMDVNEKHLLLSKWEGNWIGDVTVWTAPKSKPTKNTTTIKRNSILGGRFIESRFTGDFMYTPFEGFTIIGYNNATKIFEQYAADNMGTGIMTYKGKLNSDGKTISFEGKSTDPINGKVVTIKEMIQIIDNNTIITENYVPDTEGVFFKTMRIVMKRVKE